MPEHVRPCYFLNEASSVWRVGYVSFCLVPLVFFICKAVFGTSLVFSKMPAVTSGKLAAILTTGIPGTKQKATGPVAAVNILISPNLHYVQV